MSEKQLVEYTRKILLDLQSFSPHDLHEALTLVLELLGQTLKKSDEETIALYVKVASFLSCLRSSGLDHKAPYIAAAALAVLRYSEVVDLLSHSSDLGLQLDDNAESERVAILDIVGTGGDGKDTFNVSTSAAIVAAGIPGIKICKHGGKASTSNSGAGDLINRLGCDTSKVNAKTVPTLWSNNSFLFLLAPHFHFGMGHVSMIRKMLGIPTIFNVLGPLLHPVIHVNKRVLGVYSSVLAPEYAQAAALVYPDSETFVVWGHVGLDEVSPIGKTTVWHVLGPEKIDVFDIEPSMFGLQEHSLESCASLGPEANARILRDDILSGKYKLGDNNPIYDYILLNTATLYCLSEGHKDWKLGVSKANESIQSGNALAALQKFLDSVRAIEN